MPKIGQHRKLPRNTLTKNIKRVEVVRTRITLECTECKQRNYNMTKDKKSHPETYGNQEVLQDSVRNTHCTKRQNNRQQEGVNVDEW